jgi:hypothetical protein
MFKDRVISILKEFIIPSLVIPTVFTVIVYYYPSYFNNKDNELRGLYLIQWTLIFSVSVIALYLGTIYAEIIGRVKDIGDRSGTSVELLQYGREEKYKTSFELPIQLIKNAKSEILILDYFPWPGFSEGDPKINDIGSRHKTYYQELINVATKKNGVAYHRIVQLPNGDFSPSISRTLLGNGVVKKHFNKMIELMNNNLSSVKVSIKTCKTVYPTTTFIIIDKIHVIWEIPYLIDEKDFKFDLDLYIVDSQGKLAKKLFDKFSKLSDIATPLKL